MLCRNQHLANVALLTLFLSASCQPANVSFPDAMHRLCGLRHLTAQLNLHFLMSDTGTRT